MHILITGGTGLIGSALSRHFLSKNHKITILTRSFKKKVIGAHMVQSLGQIKDKIDIVINLAGKGIADSRWNKKVKDEIYTSRIDTTKNLIKYINELRNKPKLMISGSAIGYYGTDPAKIFVEENKVSKESFLTKLCKLWEKGAEKIDKSVRLCVIRTGVVLSKEGGALPKMAMPARFYLGANLGSGDQFLSWIHMDDLVHAIDHIIENKDIRGPINLTSPNAVTNKEFTDILSRSLGTKAFFNIPAFMAKILFGEVAEEVLLEGQKVYPKKLLDNDFKFKFEELGPALKQIFSK